MEFFISQKPEVRISTIKHEIILVKTSSGKVIWQIFAACSVFSIVNAATGLK